MSLFAYKGRLADGKEKAGKVTAKSEKHARDRVATELGIVEVLSIDHQSEPTLSPADSPSKLKPSSKLQRMLYLQHGRCFFCGQELSENEATIEHLNPKAKGGTSVLSHN